jgi:hypothetical protein
MMEPTKAGALYALIVFPDRLRPRLDPGGAAGSGPCETPAVILEIPVILAASWFACRWTVDWLDFHRTVPTRSLMGGVALLVLMTVEFGLGWVLGRAAAADASVVGRRLDMKTRSLAGS